MLSMLVIQFYKTHDNIFGYSVHAATALKDLPIIQNGVGIFQKSFSFRTITVYKSLVI